MVLVQERPLIRRELLAALAGSIQGVTGGKYGMQQVQSSGVLGPGISDLLQRQTDQYTGSTRPKAFLNWVLLDSLSRNYREAI